MNGYSWPPMDQERAEEWSYDHPLDAVAYAVGWLASGKGYGPEQAREEWPECPGFDWEDGVPEWSEIEKEPGYEYRTVLYIGYQAPDLLGWELVSYWGINPEPELFNKNGVSIGTMYIGEDNLMVVYRRKEKEEA